jgi:hypothetical protein
MKGTAPLQPLPTATPQMLSGGRWISYSDVNSEESSIVASVALFDGITQQVQLFETGQVIPESIVSDYTDEYSWLDTSSVNGFMKLSLDSSFGHSAYIKTFRYIYLE